MYDAYKNGDQRKDEGILYWPVYKLSVSGSVNSEYPKYNKRWDDTECFLKKYLPRKGYASTTATPDLNFRNNLRMYRFSETLLYATELILRTKGIEDINTKTSDAEALRYINQVISRAFRNSEQNLTEVSLKDILKQRELEFVGENIRYWDLIRFNDPFGTLAARGYTLQKKFLPIPQTEIDKAKGTLIQNNY